MSTTQAVTRIFLGWYREGFAATLAGNPAVGRARADLPATLSLTGDGTQRQGQVPVEIAGPGDVIGLDASEIRRCEPFDGCADFEPEYLPYVELMSPDLPWRFTPLGPESSDLRDPEHSAGVTQQRHLQPWLALVVVPSQLAALAPAVPGGLPVLTCPGAELPDPRESWAWAHVQVSTTDADAGTDPVVLAGDTTRSLARLVGPRRLTSGVAYGGYLVPTFTAGLASAGIALDGRDPLSPAWTPTDAEVRLPVYYSFTFTTGIAGTFESLARRLRPRPAPDATAGRTVRLDGPGWGVVGKRGATTVVQGALRPAPTATTPAEMSPDPAYAAALAGAISATSSGLELRPPIYGQDYAGGTTVVHAGTAGWLTQLNTDPRRRLAAGLGAWVVTVLQDELVDRAWAAWRDHGAVSELPAVIGDVIAARASGTFQAALPAALARMARPGGPLARAGTAILPPAAAPTSATQPSATFAPTFPDPTWSLLAAVSQEWLLPGAGDIPDESVLALRTNPAFVESFLIGLNHALARELAWRRFPIDPTATMFSRFWSAAAGATDTGIGPIASWDPNSDLGTHGQPGDRLVLLVRGGLLRRFPTTSVYLAGSMGNGSERQLAPSVAARLDPSTTFYGFEITPEEARQPAGNGPVKSWSLVLQESVDHIRLGLDTAPDNGVSAKLSSWQDLDWAHPHVAGHTYVPVAGPLAGATRPVSSGSGAAAAVWGADAGQLAAALTRTAFRVRIPVGLWMET